MERLFAFSIAGPTWQGVPRRLWALLMLISLLLLVPGQCSVPVMDRDEARYAQASKQMLETGDFVDIRFQDEVRYVKPAGTYWLQAASAALFGGPDADIWAYRLPSLLGALLAIGATLWFGARLFSSQTGFAAALLLAFCLLVAVEARTAKTDALLLASTMIAQIALFFIVLPRTADPKMSFWGAPAMFWAAIGVGIMIKGPIGPMISAATLAAFSLWTRDLSWFRRLRIMPGLLVMIAIAAPWLIAITLKTNGGFLEESLGHAFAGKIAQSDDSHGGPFGYHTLLLPVTFWPSALFLGLAGLYAWRNRTDETVQYLIAWIVPTWLIFELTVTKLPHYIIPVAPAIALLAARGLEFRADLAGDGTARVLHWVFGFLFVVVTVAVAGLALGASYYLGVPFSAASLFSGALGLIVLSVGLWTLAAFRPHRLLWFALSLALFLGVTFQWAIPNVDRFWMTRAAERAVDALEGCPEKVVATAGYREPSAVFAFGTQTELGSGASAAAHLAQHSACGVSLVAKESEEEFLDAAHAARIPLSTLGRVEGYNYVKGDPLTLSIFAHADGRLTSERAER